MGREITEGCQPHILAKMSFSPHIIPKTKGLEESLPSGKSVDKTKGLWIFVGYKAPQD